MKPTVRFLMPGALPTNLELPSFDMTAQDVFALGSGGGSAPDGHTLTVNGQAGSDQKVRAGDTVALQPNAENG